MINQCLLFLFNGPDTNLTVFIRAFLVYNYVKQAFPISQSNRRSAPDWYSSGFPFSELPNYTNNRHPKNKNFAFRPRFVSNQHRQTSCSRAMSANAFRRRSSHLRPQTLNDVHCGCVHAYCPVRLPAYTGCCSTEQLLHADEPCSHT